MIKQSNWIKITDLIYLPINIINRASSIIDGRWGMPTHDWDKDKFIKKGEVRPKPGSFYKLDLVSISEQNSTRYRNDSNLDSVYQTYSFNDPERVDYNSGNLTAYRVSLPMHAKDYNYFTLIFADYAAHVVNNSKLFNYYSQIDLPERKIILENKLKGFNFQNIFPKTNAGFLFFTTNCLSVLDDLDTYYREKVSANIIPMNIDLTNVSGMINRVLSINQNTPNQATALSSLSSEGADSFFKAIVHVFCCSYRYRLMYRVENLENRNMVTVMNILFIFIFGFVDTYDHLCLIHMLKFLHNAMNSTTPLYRDRDRDLPNFNPTRTDANTQKINTLLLQCRITLGREVSTAQGLTNFGYNYNNKQNDFVNISSSPHLNFNTPALNTISANVEARIDAAISICQSLSTSYSNVLANAIRNLSNQRLGLIGRSDSIASLIQSVYLYASSVGCLPFTRFSTSNGNYNLMGLDLIEIHPNGPFTLLLTTNGVKSFLDMNIIKEMSGQASFLFYSDLLLRQLKSVNQLILQSYYNNGLTVHHPPEEVFLSYKPFGGSEVSNIWERYGKCITMKLVSTYQNSSDILEIIVSDIEANLTEWGIGEGISNSGPFITIENIVTRSRERDDNFTTLTLDMIESDPDDLSIKNDTRVEVLYNYKFTDYNDIDSIDFKDIMEAVINGKTKPLNLPMIEDSKLLKRNPKWNMFGTIWTVEKIPFVVYKKLLDVVAVRLLFTFVWNTKDDPEVVYPVSV